MDFGQRFKRQGHCDLTAHVKHSQQTFLVMIKGTILQIFLT